MIMTKNSVIGFELFLMLWAHLGPEIQFAADFELAVTILL